MTKKEILPLTSLRFFAALYVFFYHMNRWPLVTETSAIGQIVTHGAIGMSLFFILSGFVLAYRFKDGIENIRSYAFMRFSRIYPIYVLAALSMVPWLISVFTEMHAEPRYLIGRYVFIVFVNLILMQAWMPQLFGYWNIGGSWSISVEAFLYAIFPLAINPMRKLSNCDIYITLFIFFLGASLPSISYFLFPNPPDALVFYVIPIFRLAEFMGGVACGLLFSRGVRIPFPSFVAVLSLTTLFTYLIYGPHFPAIAESWVAVPLFTLLTFSFASLKNCLLYKLVTNRVFIGLGHISYSFYSIQILILTLLIFHHAKIVECIPQLAKNWILFISTFCVLASTSTVSFYLIEVRFRDYLNDLWHKKQRDNSANTTMQIAI